MTEPAPPEVRPRPVTGNAVIDAALVELGTLADIPLADHHDRLAAVQDVLTGVLESSREAVQTPIPGVPR